MQFPVPQFIDVEDKIIGPFTLKQFGFIFSGGIIILGFFKLLGLGFLFYLLSFPVAIIFLVLAFASYNGQKLYNFIPTLIKFAVADKVLVFNRRASSQEIVVRPLTDERLADLNKTQDQPAPIVEPVQSRLHKLAMLLDQKNNDK